MYINKEMASRLLALVAITTTIAMTPVSGNAASLAAENLGLEITRDAASLRDYVSTHPVDPDSVNTALIFTNAGNSSTRVGCIAYNQNGTPIDRGWVRIAKNGMRFVLASEVAGGRDFVGNVKCKSPGRVIGSAVLLAPGLTDLPVKQHQHDGNTYLRFPVIAAY